MRIENEKRKEETKLILRVYKPADCKALTELFYETVHSVNTKDYTNEQVDAWADGKVDLEKIITDTYAFGDAAKAFHDFSENGANMLKVVIDFTKLGGKE